MKSTDNRRITVARWEMPDNEVCEIQVWYPTVKDMKRQYNLSVQPMEIKRYSDGVVMHHYVPTRGYRTVIETAERYNRKRLEEIAARPEVIELARKMYERCLLDVEMKGE